MESILDHLERQAAERPTAPFISEADRTYTYGEAFAETLRIAGHLHERGLRSGDRALLLVESRARHLLSYFAVMANGAIPVHLNTQRPRAFVEFAAGNTGARMIVTQDYAEGWKGMGIDIVEYPADGIEAPSHWAGERHEIAYMMYTSGTTGNPKAVITTQANTLFTARTIIDFASLGPGERELIALPLSFTFGLGHIHSQVILGGQARLFPSMRDTDGLLDMMAGDGITGFLASPGMIRSLVEEHTERFVQSARNLRYIVINCTPMPVALTGRLLELLPHVRSYMYYGLTEASRSAFNHYNANPDKIGCTGKATRGVSLKIDNADPHTGEGEICIKGPNVMPHYWGETECSCIRDGWFHTGDLGVMDADGYITVRGRTNDQISIDGIKCQPFEVEQVLNAWPGVRESAVAGVHDEKTYQAVAAAVVVEGSRSRAEMAALASELAAHCRANVEPQKVPTRFLFVEAVPRTELGKIVRSAVRQMFEERSAEVLFPPPGVGVPAVAPQPVAEETT